MHFWENYKTSCTLCFSAFWVKRFYQKVRIDPRIILGFGQGQSSCVAEATPERG